MEIGVLALQGAFREHRKLLSECGVESREIRRPQHLEGIRGLIIPGGESTTIGKLMVDYELLQPVRELGLKGMPIWGTCAGMVLLAKEIVNSNQPRLSLMDVTVVRNAFGRQVDSFEAELRIGVMGLQPFPAVFIRAPYIESAKGNVEVLAVYSGRIVLARQGNILAASFHPELTEDVRLHKHFADIVYTAECGNLDSRC